MSNNIYKFDDYFFDPRRKVMLKNNQLVPLESKVTSTLMCLIENKGKVVSEEELINAVWNKTIIEDSCLRRNISVLRSTLDRSQPNRYIETVLTKAIDFAATLHLLDARNRCHNCTQRNVAGDRTATGCNVAPVQTGVFHPIAEESAMSINSMRTMVFAW